jgi:hypothetical protein
MAGSSPGQPGAASRRRNRRRTPSIAFGQHLANQDKALVNNFNIVVKLVVCGSPLLAVLELVQWLSVTHTAWMASWKRREDLLA